MAGFTAWDIGACGCTGGGGTVNCVTCGASPGIPTTLYITDALGGPYAATWDATLSIWLTPQLCAPSQTPSGTCQSGVAACEAKDSNNTPLYVYGIGCTSVGYMTLIRYWYELRCISPPNQYVPCGCQVGGGMQAFSSSGSVAVTCGSIAWSGTLTRIVGNLSDPVGGTTSFTE
jgi:hypothetical protein